jgi:hypothetical protein
VDDICTLADVVIVNPIRANLISQATFSHGLVDSGSSGEGRILLQLLPNRHVSSSCHRGFFDVFTNSPTIFFINVLTWNGQQRAPEALLYWFCIPFTNKECQ